MNATTSGKPLNRFGQLWLQMPSWLVLLLGLAFGLLVSVIMMRLLMAPTTDKLFGMVQELTTYSALSLALGFVIYRVGWTRSPSLVLTLGFTFAWAALLTLFNVWQMARLMFASRDDVIMASIFLMFAVIIATFFGITVMTRVTTGLRELAHSAARLAEGDLDVRVSVPGRDEVSQLAFAFNQMSTRLKETEAQRQELEQMRSDLIAWTSHDLRTPLTSIRAIVEALHDGLVDDPETIQRYYFTIRQDVIRLNNLIDDLFELAQLGAGKMVFEREPHSLSDLISDTLESFRAFGEQLDIKIEGTVDSRIDPVVMNSSKIQRVLSNLISNAFNYTPAGGAVYVDAKLVGDGVEVCVRDTGPGFAEIDLDRVFEKFYRGERARSRDKGNAGLGLAIARGIVEAHGGRISAANAPEGGAVLTFWLPKLGVGATPGVEY